MSEELQDAAYQLPRTIMRTSVINGALGLVAVITMCYCIGNTSEVVNTPYIYAFIQVFYNSTGSKAATSAMTAIILVMVTFCCITMMASASRQLFAFARDGGFPFARWHSYVGKPEKK